MVKKFKLFTQVHDVQWAYNEQIKVQYLKDKCYTKKKFFLKFKEDCIWIFYSQEKVS